MFRPSQERINRFKEFDRNLGRYAEKFSRFLWPWRELWLLAAVGGLISLDFTSTWAILELSGKENVYEAGKLAGWALERGGFLFLLLVDIAAAGALAMVALISRHLYVKKGYAGYGRAAFVFVLAPYIVITILAIINNIILHFR